MPNTKCVHVSAIFSITMSNSNSKCCSKQIFFFSLLIIQLLVCKFHDNDLVVLSVHSPFKMVNFQNRKYQFCVNTKPKGKIKLCLLLGCQYGKPSRNLCLISWVFLFFVFLFLNFFSVSVKVLPVTPLLSGVFVHRAFCAYFLRIERVVGNA